MLCSFTVSVCILIDLESFDSRFQFKFGISSETSCPASLGTQLYVSETICSVPLLFLCVF